MDVKNGPRWSWWSPDSRSDGAAWGHAVHVARADGHGVVFIATSNTSVEHDVRLYQPEPLRGRDHEFEIETSYKGIYVKVW